MSVFVLDQRKRPVMPGCEKRARLLLERGRAVVNRRYPFTIGLRDRVGGDVEPVRIKLDPGSRTTGIAVVADEHGNKPAKVLCLFEPAHRGRQISEAFSRLGIQKTHALDAACGEVGALVFWPQPTLAIKPSARGNDCRAKLTAHGFPSRLLHAHQIRSRLPNRRHGVSRDVNPQGGRGWRCRGSSQRLFESGQADPINAKYCKLLHRADGYGYARNPRFLPVLKNGVLKRGRL